ncbi:MAG: hypothetical protein ABW051_09595, partial [Burkholderiaceae bacterium]
MFGWLKKKDVPGAAPPGLTPASSPELIAWTEGADLPIPDWRRHEWPEASSAEADARANGLAASWLDALAAALPEGYRRSESANFMLLSALEERPARVLLEYLEKSLRRVLGTLPDLASDE